MCVYFCNEPTIVFSRISTLRCIANIRDDSEYCTAVAEAAMVAAAMAAAAAAAAAGGRVLGLGKARKIFHRPFCFCSFTFHIVTCILLVTCHVTIDQRSEGCCFFLCFCFCCYFCRCRRRRSSSSHLGGVSCHLLLAARCLPHPPLPTSACSFSR